MSQIRKNIRLSEHYNMLRAVKLYFEENSINLSRYFLSLIKYYLITGDFYDAGTINIEPYLPNITQVNYFCLFVDTDDSVLNEWLEKKETNKTFAKETRLILNNSFSKSEITEIKPFEIVYNDCEVLTLENRKKTDTTINTQTEKIDRLINLLNKITPEELDRLLKTLEEKPAESDTTKNLSQEAPEDNEEEQDEYENTQKVLSNINQYF